METAAPPLPTTNCDWHARGGSSGGRRARETGRLAARRGEGEEVLATAGAGGVAAAEGAGVGAAGWHGALRPVLCAEPPYLEGGRP